LAHWAQAEFPRFHKELAALSGLDAEWTRSGLLVLEPAWKEEALAWGKNSGSLVEALQDGLLRETEPQLNRELRHGLFLPEVAHVRNNRLLSAVAQAVRRLGGEIQAPVTVRSILVKAGRAVGVLTDQGEVAAERVILAAGAWSAELLGEHRHGLAIEPVRGQMLLYRGAPGLVRHILLKGPHYIVPRRDGHLLVGSTVERVGFDAATTEAARQELRAAAESLVPALADMPIIGHWAGLRPGSPDGVPVIGPHPDIEGLYINTGHYRNGVLLAPASARLLADLILGRPPIVAPEPFAFPSRTAINSQD
jgi:glycine oxidase